MAISIKGAIVGGLVLVGLASWQYKTAQYAHLQIAALRQQVGSLRHRLTDKSNSDYDVQRHACSNRSQYYFTSLGYRENETKANGSSTFQNHYSRRLGRCLMTLETSSFTGGREVITKILIDTDERQTFGDYTWVSSDTQKYYEQKPMQCHLTPPDKDESYCHSTDQYDEFVKDMLSS